MARFRKYDLSQSNPDALYEEIKHEMEQKRDSAVKPISHFTKAGILSGLLQSGYETGVKGFPTLDSALSWLYTLWKEIREEFEKTVK